MNIRTDNSEKWGMLFSFPKKGSIKESYFLIRALNCAKSFFSLLTIPGETCIYKEIRFFLYRYDESDNAKKWPFHVIHSQCDCCWTCYLNRRSCDAVVYPLWLPAHPYRNYLTTNMRHFEQFLTFGNVASPMAFLSRSETVASPKKYAHHFSNCPLQTCIDVNVIIYAVYTNEMIQ